jgi:hypothetical protein
MNMRRCRVWRVTYVPHGAQRSTTGASHAVSWGESNRRALRPLRRSRRSGMPSQRLWERDSGTSLRLRRCFVRSASPDGMRHIACGERAIAYRCRDPDSGVSLSQVELAFCVPRLKSGLQRRSSAGWRRCRPCMPARFDCVEGHRRLFVATDVVVSGEGSPAADSVGSALQLASFAKRGVDRRALPARRWCR